MTNKVWTRKELDKFIAEYPVDYFGSEPKSKKIERICLKCNRIVDDVTDHVRKGLYICEELKAKENPLVSWLNK